MLLLAKSEVFMSSLMKNSLANRIDKLKLKKTKLLMPLFEAITNSIQAIEESKIDNGSISIELDRKHEVQTPIFTDPEALKLMPINNVTIKDNGVGFTPENFDSFLTYDSTFKKSKGGKGEGRLFWLKAFEQVEVKSFYTESNKFYKISFIFSIKDDGVDDKNLSIGEISKEKFLQGTTIKFKNLKETFRETFSQSLHSIGKEIINHFISYFVDESKCPKIIIKDEFDSLSINSLYSDILISKDILKTHFCIDNYNFELYYLKLKALPYNTHQLHLCADRREVESIQLKAFVPNFSISLKDAESGFNYYYQIFLSGLYLDKNVNSDRSGFLFEDSEMFISNDRIIKQTIEQIKIDLSDILKNIQTNKVNKIGDYVRKKSPQYRILLNDKYNSFLENVSPKATGKDLEMDLYEQYYKINKEAKKKAHELENNKLESTTDIEKFNNTFINYMNEINDMGKSKLAEYVVCRKSILQILSNLQKQQDDKKYPFEKAIHKTIFPMNKSSDDIDYEKHNLWVIDEKLAYHYYLASDKKIKSMDIVESDSNKEPDIIIFDHPFLLSDNERNTALTIFEFKRPERDDYTDEENPILQVINYVKDLRNSKIHDKSGETINIAENTPIYAYIICTLTPKMREVAVDQYDFVVLPDGNGYIGYHKTHRIYFQIISYKKMIQDAKDRNKILFDKLNI